MDFYKITNENNGNSVPLNEVKLLRLIKSLGTRYKVQRDDFIEVWENLSGKKFSEKFLDGL